MMMRKEALFIGLFPYGKAWAGRSPRLNDFGVRPRVWTNPFKQVKNQGIYDFRHGSLLSGKPEHSI